MNKITIKRFPLSWEINMKQILNRLINQESISSEEAKQVLVNISKGDYNQSQIASFLTVYMMRNVTIEELSGFRDALLELCIPIDLETYNAIDLCGTGGDGKDTFNISTLASFVTSGAGIQVAKHGNYGVSSTCGSSNVLEHLGVKFTSDKDFLKRSLDEAGICVLHAPLFHPAMKNVAPIRRELGVKTFFNMLGPMVNPSFPKHQLVGVFNLELLRMYGYLYQNTNTNYTILHALDGYDEISLTGPTKVIQKTSEYILNPEDFGLETLNQEAIHGGNSVATSAKIFTHILNGQGTEAQNQVVCTNAAMAIATVTDKSISESFELAKESLIEGKALNSFKKLITLSKKK
jgi:anthranilate phosphoribosyltransferase